MAKLSEGPGRHAGRILIGVAIIIPLLSLFFSVTPFGSGLEKRTYDLWFLNRGSREKPSDIVVVEIDVDTEQSLGRYPWPRTYHAKLIRNLAEDGARVVVFDATFGDALPEDPEFLAVLEETGITVLGAKTTSRVDPRMRMRGLEQPAGDLARLPYGIVDINADPLDNVVREYPILQYYQRGTVQKPQLGIRALMKFLELSPTDSVAVTGRGWRLGDIEIPRGPGGGMLINFLGYQRSVSYYSYWQIIDDAETFIGEEYDWDAWEDTKGNGYFDGKIVFVGSTIPEDQDYFATPFLNEPGVVGASLTPGVEVHAHAVDTILRQRFIHVAPFWTNALLIIVVGVGVTLLSARLKAIWGGVFSLGMIGLVMGVSYLLFSRFDVWLLAASPAVTVAFAYTGSTISLYVVEQQEKARIRGMFQQYVPPRVVSELMAHPELLALGGEERELTVLFSDVANFTSISEDLTPSDLVGLLNEYLTSMTEIVVENDGIIDKYEGDALMAEFGAPVPYEEHALKACKAALDMQRTLVELRENWSKEGRPELTARIGINTGVMLVGNMGSRHIMDYTVMGDNVNLASRLEGTNKVYGTRICISEPTYDVVAGEIISRELDLIRVKGKHRPVRIFEVLETTDQGIPAGRAAMIERFEMGLYMYRERQFADAHEIFADILELSPDDGPSLRYKARCQQYIEKPPPDDWDGVFVMTTK